MVERTVIISRRRKLDWLGLSGKKRMNTFHSDFTRKNSYNEDALKTSEREFLVETEGARKKMQSKEECTLDR